MYTTLLKKNLQKRIDAWVALNDSSALLDLSQLGLTELPKIPSNCQRLDCDVNKLTVLPELPNCRELHCSNNRLIVLPELPNCWMLYCQGNLLTVLPELPNCRILLCHGNLLTFLPELSNCRMLYCNNNLLTSLPELPNCKTLYCYDNKYLWITKKHSRSCGIEETPNYTKCARIIQRTYRRYIIRKSKLLDGYLLRDPSKIVCLYI
jgi:Leucine-rich repeat (LRR) protein